jgi:hypothetical protein
MMDKLNRREMLLAAVGVALFPTLKVVRPIPKVTLFLADEVMMSAEEYQLYAFKLNVCSCLIANGMNVPRDLYPNIPSLKIERSSP